MEVTKLGSLLSIIAAFIYVLASFSFTCLFDCLTSPFVFKLFRVSIVIEEFIRLLHSCGLPASDVDLVHGNGNVVGEILSQAHPASILFTGSKNVAEKLAREHHGRIFLEDAGFDWKILGPDVQDFDYVAWQCDQDAYASNGQKCSATVSSHHHVCFAC